MTIFTHKSKCVGFSLGGGVEIYHTDCDPIEFIESVRLADRLSRHPVITEWHCGGGHDHFIRSFPWPSDSDGGLFPEQIIPALDRFWESLQSEYESRRKGKAMADERKRIRLERLKASARAQQIGDSTEG